LGHRLDELDVHGAPVDGPYQAHACPGEADVRGVGATSKVRAMSQS